MTDVDHEPGDILAADNEVPRAESRAARREGTTPDGADTPRPGPAPSDDAQVASEPMVLEQVPEPLRRAPTPPGRQRTGDEPAVP